MLSQKKFPTVYEQASGRQLPRQAIQNKSGTKRILTEKQLAAIAVRQRQSTYVHSVTTKQLLLTPHATRADAVSTAVEKPKKTSADIHNILRKKELRTELRSEKVEFFGTITVFHSSLLCSEITPKQLLMVWRLGK